MKNTIRKFLAILSIACFVSPAAAGDLVEVRLSTEYGDIRLALDSRNAPKTTANFLRYVDAGHYDGAAFYRTVRYGNDNGSPKIEVIQGGLGDGEPAFEPIGHEDTEETGILHTDGVISMARGEVGTASSEFFICIGDQPGLDKGQSRNADRQGFAAFGRVVDGMDVVQKIHRLPSDGPADNAYVEGQIIEAPAVIHRARRVSDSPGRN